MAIYIFGHIRAYFLFAFQLFSFELGLGTVTAGNYCSIGLVSSMKSFNTFFFVTTGIVMRCSSFLFCFIALILNILVLVSCKLSRFGFISSFELCSDTVQAHRLKNIEISSVNRQWLSILNTNEVQLSPFSDKIKLS